MKKFIATGILASAFSMMALAADMSGSLLDETCYNSQKQAATCQATASTTAFALMSSGKVYKLDSTGNEKAATAMKARADRSKDPDQPAKVTAVAATVSGTVTGDTIQVDSISVQ